METVVFLGFYFFLYVTFGTCVTRMLTEKIVRCVWTEEIEFFFCFVLQVIKEKTLTTKKLYRKCNFPKIHHQLTANYYLFFVKI